ncbi:hypothetical protein RG47T_5094 [Mucilaginibacter polytrichastri]|uniref:Uncharacterized protein n=1 Tax=Mucilaginibacter polytrichastri TaxID=1302689 RepID=A0A1Q6A6H2_9SPHI|nr:hypothetical protein RG47T_5094 [Mucilaginibacter polytrichastri]
MVRVDSESRSATIDLYAFVDITLQECMVAHNTTPINKYLSFIMGLKELSNGII